MADEGKPRGPGRPPKRDGVAGPRMGVVAAPADADNVLEYVSDTPMRFKMVFSYLKGLYVRDIHLCWTPEGLELYAHGAGSSETRTVLLFPAEHAVHYYCPHPIWMGLNRSNVDGLFGSINREIYKVIFTVRGGTPDRLQVSLYEASLAKENAYSIVTSNLDSDFALYGAKKDVDPAAFPLRFTLPTKKLKESLAKAVAYSDTISITKVGDTPLSLNYECVNVLRQCETYNDADTVELHSEVKKRQEFHCTLKVGALKGLVAAFPFPAVRIHCREAGDAMFSNAEDEMALWTFVAPVVARG
jgi:hypothetical protein